MARLAFKFKTENLIAKCLIITITLLNQKGTDHRTIQCIFKIKNLQKPRQFLRKTLTHLYSKEQNSSIRIYSTNYSNNTLFQPHLHPCLVHSQSLMTKRLTNALIRWLYRTLQTAQVLTAKKQISNSFLLVVLC